MSIKLMSAIWDHGPAGQSERFVLLALADHANDAGECYPSIDRIASKTCMTRRNVFRVLGRLQEGGWLEMDSGRGRHNVNRYRIKMVTECHHCAQGKGDIQDRKGDIEPRKGDRMSPEPSITINKPSEGEKREGFSLDLSEPDKPGPMEQIVEAWNSMAGEAGLAKVSQITEVRRKVWNARVKEAGGADAVIAIIKAIPESDLLAGRVRGREGGKPWKATFDWIGKQGNWTKLIEGQYHGGEPPKTRTVSKEDRDAMVRRQMKARQELNGRVV